MSIEQRLEDERLEDIYTIGPYNFCGKYACTKSGKIYSHVNKKFLQGFPDGKRGYLKVKLYDDRKMPVTLFIHRIICTVFNGAEPDMQVNHEVGNKLNNYYTNLTWMTPLSNVRHSIINKLSESRSNQMGLDTVHDICHCLFVERMTTAEISKKFGVSRDSIHKIKVKKNYKYISKLYELERFND